MTEASGPRSHAAVRSDAEFRLRATPGAMSSLVS